MQEDPARKVRPRLPFRRIRRSLRWRLLAATVTVAALAIALFAAPLAVAVQHLYFSDAVARLQADATRVAASVPDTLPDARRPFAAPAGLSPGLSIGVYTAAGRRISGTGPSRSAIAADAADGRTHHSTGELPGSLVVSAPVPSDGAVAVTVRVASSMADITDRSQRAWAAMAALAAVVLAVATAVAALHTRRISRPLERLTEEATALGHGDFSVKGERSGIEETDAASAALERTAERLGHVLARERSFSRDVSHQLRTPLAGLLLGLEAAADRPDADLRAAITTAIARTRRMQSTVDDLLTLTRPASTSSATDVVEVVAAAENQWRGLLAQRDRTFRVRVEAAPLPVSAPAGAVRQILDVLLDNALRHGDGAVELTVSDAGHVARIEVADEGRWVAGDQPDTGGLGLPLARSLAESADGRLVVPQRGSRSVFRVLLRTASAGQDHSAS